MIPEAGKNASAAFSLNAQERSRRLFRIGPFKQPGKAELVLNADIAGYNDRVTRNIAVKPLGFPVESGFGGL
ncbi:MAG: hypothetical protein ACPHJ3_16705, partial [Rubripirellula sp.]